jgi:hypothetical protein
MSDQDFKPGEDSGEPSHSIPEPIPAKGAYTGQPDDLHDLIGTPSTGKDDEEDPLAALRDDPNYAALIRDLEYIASQARLLFSPAEEAPSDDLWNKIQSKLAEDPEEKD